MGAGAAPGGAGAGCALGAGVVPVPDCLIAQVGSGVHLSSASPQLHTAQAGRKWPYHGKGP